MNYLKKVYIYWFCSFYKLMESSSFIGGSDFRATSIMSILEFFFISALFGCYLLYTKHFIQLGNPLLVLASFALFIGLIKYIVFYHKSKWKNYISMFDNLSQKKRQGILIITWMFNIIFVIMCVKIFVLVYNIDWVN